MGFEVYVYILIMAAVTYALRVIPMTLIRKEITNQFVMSFLYYVPYVTLAVMTFPAIMEATNTIYGGIIALVIGIILAWFGASLFQIALLCCALVFISELVISYM